MSEEKITDYYAVQTRDLEELQREVNVMLAQGYELHGELIVTALYSPEGGNLYEVVQVMVKRGEA